MASLRHMLTALTQTRPLAPRRELAYSRQRGCLGRWIDCDRAWWNETSFTMGSMVASDLCIPGQIGTTRSPSSRPAADDAKTPPLGVGATSH